jgi:FkbM family methyltransferase
MSRKQSDFIVFLRRVWRNLNRRVSRLWLDLRGPRTQHEMVRLGSEENGWYAPADMPEGALCYCIGVGYDATYDFAIAARGAQVHAFDPTPHAIGYMEETNKGQVTFHPWGVSDANTTMRLYFPLEGTHGSYFAEDLHGTGKFHEVPCFTMATIMEKLAHSEIYLMKMDIEGSWYPALRDMMMSRIFPTFLQVEYDSPAPLWRVRPIAKLLEANGYALILREADNAIYKRVAAA